MKRIVVISASHRVGSNSEILAKKFADGAIEAGHTVEFVSLKGKKLAFCRGCMACQKIKRCVIDDDANAIADIISASDVVVFATPIYYYSVSGQLKTLIDRANSLYCRNNKFEEAHLLCTAADDAEHTPDAAEATIRGWVACFDGVTYGKTFFFGGLDEANAASDPELLAKARECGKAI